MKQTTNRHDQTRLRSASGRHGSRTELVALSCLVLALFASCAAPSYGETGDDACRGALCDEARGFRNDAAVVDTGLAPSRPPARPNDGSDARAPDAPSADAAPGWATDDAGSDAAPDGQPPIQMTEPGPSSPGTPESGFAVGSYVVHARYYGVETSSGFSYAEDNVMLGRVARDPRGGLTLAVQNCANYSNAASGTGLGTTARIVKLERYPERLFSLQVTGDVFQTTGPPTRAGYAQLKAGTCPVGTAVPVMEPAPSWQSDGTCTCVSDDAPPSGVDDCRVIDSDGDGNPGFTVHWSGAVTRDLFSVRRDNSQLIEGKVSPNGHHSATFLPRHEHVTLQAATGSTAPATGLAIRPCVSSVNNPVRFAPLGERSPSGAEWTCAEMLQQTASLFVEPLKAPSDC